MPRMAGRREGDWRMNISWEKKGSRKRKQESSADTEWTYWLACNLTPDHHAPVAFSIAIKASMRKKKKRKKEKNLHTVWIQLLCTGFDFCNHLLLLAGWSQINVQDTLFVIKKIMRYQPAKAKNLWCALAAGNLKYVSSQAVTLRTQLTENLCLVSLSERLRVSDCLFDYWMQWSACIATS